MIGTHLNQLSRNLWLAPFLFPPPFFFSLKKKRIYTQTCTHTHAHPFPTSPTSQISKSSPEVICSEINSFHANLDKVPPDHPHLQESQPRTLRRRRCKRLHPPHPPHGALVIDLFFNFSLYILQQFLSFQRRWRGVGWGGSPGSEKSAGFRWGGNKEKSWLILL